MFTKPDSTDVVLGACANLEGTGPSIHNPHRAWALFELEDVLVVPGRAPHIIDRETEIHIWRTA